MKVYFSVLSSLLYSFLVRVKVSLVDEFQASYIKRLEIQDRLENLLFRNQFCCEVIVLTV